MTNACHSNRCPPAARQNATQSFPRLLEQGGCHAYRAGVTDGHSSCASSVRRSSRRRPGGCTTHGTPRDSRSGRRYGRDATWNLARWAPRSERTERGRLGRAGQPSGGATDADARNRAQSSTAATRRCPHGTGRTTPVPRQPPEPSGVATPDGPSRTRAVTSTRATRRCPPEQRRRTSTSRPEPAPAPRSDRPASPMTPACPGSPEDLRRDR
jgi:hypothetical protein